MEDKNLAAVVDAIGEVLNKRGFDELMLTVELEETKKKLAAMEKELQALKAEKSGVLCARGVGVE